LDQTGPKTDEHKTTNSRQPDLSGKDEWHLGKLDSKAQNDSNEVLFKPNLAEEFLEVL
jgi:hypothetical protein